MTPAGAAGAMRFVRWGVDACRAAAARLARGLDRIDRYDLAAALLFAALVVLVGLTFGDYAISNDEEVQQRYGELIVAYYRSGFVDQAVFHFRDLYLYGGLFDIAAVGLEKLIPLDTYAVRHILSALTGIGGLAAVWATARTIAGPRAGLLAAAMLAVCGTWYGTMFNHTKDIPFAAAMMAATYFLVRIGRELPRPRWRLVALFGVCCGAALGIRVLGVFLLAYAGLVVVLQAPIGRASWREIVSVRRPLRAAVRRGVRAGVRDHDRGLAVGRFGAAQSVARIDDLRRLQLPDPHHARRPSLQDGRRAALVRPDLPCHQADALAARRRGRCARSRGHAAPRGRRRTPRPRRTWRGERKRP